MAVVCGVIAINCIFFQAGGVVRLSIVLFRLSFSSRFTERGKSLHEVRTLVLPTPALPLLLHILPPRIPAVAVRPRNVLRLLPFRNTPRIPL